MANPFPDTYIGVGRVYLANGPGSDDLHLVTQFEIEATTDLDSLFRWLDILVEAGVVLDIWVMLRDDYHGTEIDTKVRAYIQSIIEEPPCANSTSN